MQIVVTTEEDLEVYFLQLPVPNGPTFYQVLPDEINVCYWKLADSGEKTFIREELGKGALSHSMRTTHKPPTSYYGMVCENRKNGDITIPVWPDCRVPLGVPASF